MQCPRCQWNNAAGLIHCFNCRSPLVSTAPTHAAPASAPTPADDPAGLAELGTRYLATLIDAIVMALGVAFVVLVYVFGLNDLPAARSGNLLMVTLLVVLAVLLLPGVLDAYGGSVGRRVMGIAVVRPNGARLNPVLGVWRHILKYAFGLGMPFIGSLIARLLLGRRFLHEWFVRAQVVPSDALPAPVPAARRKAVNPNDFAAMVEAAQNAPASAVAAAPATLKPAQAPASPLRRLKPVILGAIALFFVLPMLSAAWSIWRDASDPDKQLIAGVKRSLAPMLDQLGLYAKAHGSYPAAVEDVALDVQATPLHPAVDQMALDPQTGTVTIRLGVAPFQGQHLVFKPRPSKAAVKVTHWDCGTTDIAVNRLPSDCALAWPSDTAASTVIRH